MRTCKIDGEYVRFGASWSITDKINSSTTLNLTVVDLLGLDTIDNGDSIELYNDTDLIFSGIVRSISKREQFKNIIYWQLTATDNTALANKRIVAAVAEEELAGDIVRDEILPILAEEGVTEGDIADGPTIKKAVFNYLKCSAAMDYIKTVTGLNWNIDKDRKLNYFDRATYYAPWVLSGSVQHKDFIQNSKMENYRNRQYVRGGMGRTALQELRQPTPQPDGVSRNFVLRFPLAEKPRIYIDDIEVDPDDIGVNGLDKDKKWYFTYGSSIISHDDDEVALTGVKLEVTYTGLRNIIISAEDAEEITERAAAETGTSGIYEAIAEEKTINETAQAIEYSNGLLLKYGDISETVTFWTNVSGLQAGQLLTINKPLYGINGTYLIETVNIAPDGPGLIRYSVTALSGEAIGGWENFFREILKQGREYVIAENEVLIILYQQSEKSGLEGEYYMTERAELYPASDLYPMSELFPGATGAEVSVSD